MSSDKPRKPSKTSRSFLQIEENAKKQQELKERNKQIRIEIDRRTSKEAQKALRSVVLYLKGQLKAGRIDFQNRHMTEEQAKTIGDAICAMFASAAADSRSPSE